MRFQIAARTLFHLGAELISSDGIALYELIKNAHDARSPNVRIDIDVRLAHRLQQSILGRIDGWLAAPRKDRFPGSEAAFTDALRREIIGGLDMSSREAKAARRSFVDAGTIAALRALVIDANRIVVVDTGKGMSHRDVETAFLTIGTRSKQKLKDQSGEGDPAILGEKGIGRLSAMRLGHHLRVDTARAEDSTWSTLLIDWSLFSHESDALLDEIQVDLARGRVKPTSASGTTITVGWLARAWSKDRVKAIVDREFSKLNDPFEPRKRFPIAVHYNGELVPVPTIEKLLLRAAHARVNGGLRRLGDGSLVLSGELTYLGRTEAFSFRDENLLSLSQASEQLVLAATGPFTFEFYWYNRRVLTALEGIGDIKAVRDLLAEWAGGLLLYRDGFRVLPYGGPDDDWLGLDRKALGRAGYKVNRTQVLGRVNISGRGNPKLVDQANREGLRDSDEKRAFIEILGFVVTQVFWSFLNRTDKEEKSVRRASEPLDVSEIEERVEGEEERISRNLDRLVERVPALRSEGSTLAEVREGLGNLKQVMRRVRELADEYDEGRGQLLNLAGVGLTVEILAHEINRATERALETLGRLPDVDLPLNVTKTLETLGSQLKTLQKRLSVIDPLSTAGRNRRERFDVAHLVRDIMESHRDQFEAEQIVVDLRVLPERESGFVVRAVRGMIVQVLENLIANSVYWLRHRRSLIPDHQSRISLEIDATMREIRFSDNGPGIDRNDRDKVFEAFVTTKPAGRGKGLGLFIAREIARYHKAELNLVDDPSFPDDNLRTFVLDLENVE